MTSMPASRSVRAMILAPRSCPSRPGLATTTRILRLLAPASVPARRPPTRQPGPSRTPLRRREHDLDLDPLGDRVEAVVDRGGHEHDRARAHLGALPVHHDLAAAG